MRVWLCACVLLITGFGSQAMADSPFDGTWSARVVRQVGEQNLTIVLTSDDAGRVTGSLAGQSETELQIVWGFVKDDVIVFKVDVSLANEVLRRLGVALGRPLPFVYVGRIEGDQTAFGRRPENLRVGRLVEFIANRAQ
jgi:hypothetical protein